MLSAPEEVSMETAGDGGWGSPDTRKNFVIGRLSEDGVTGSDPNVTNGSRHDSFSSNKGLGEINSTTRKQLLVRLSAGGWTDPDR